VVCKPLEKKGRKVGCRGDSKLRAQKGKKVPQTHHDKEGPEKKCGGAGCSQRGIIKKHQWGAKDVKQGGGESGVRD